MPFNYAISAFLTLFVVVDPIGLTPTFVAVTDRLPRTARRLVAVRASIIAGVILAGSALIRPTSGDSIRATSSPCRTTSPSSFSIA